MIKSINITFDDNITVSMNLNEGVTYNQCLNYITNISEVFKKSINNIVSVNIF